MRIQFSSTRLPYPIYIGASSISTKIGTIPAYDSLTIGEEPKYAIADRGREYIVEHDLL